MRRTGVHSWTHVVAGSLIIAGVLTGCGGGGTSNSGSASTTGTNNGSTNAVASSQPSIQGSAPGTATVGQSYSFQPQASGPGSLSFTISNKPAWATFNASTGQLSGTPSASDVGTDSNIEISVTDGGSVVALPAFSITVAASGGGQQGGAGTVTLAWQAPAQNVDGTPVTDLAGYNIHYGTQSQNYTSIIKVSNPDLTTYLVQSLPVGTYYFAVTAYDSTGNEGPYSPEVSAAVN